MSFYITPYSFLLNMASAIYFNLKYILPCLETLEQQNLEISHPSIVIDRVLFPNFVLKEKL